MPQIVKTLDEIAREKGRDTLFVTFEDSRRPQRPLTAARRRLRSQLIQFLDQHSISWSPCFGCESNLLFGPYRGWIYLDVPYDLTDPAYQLIADYLETPDGKPRYEGMQFCVRTLEAAINGANGRLDPEDW